MSDDTVELHYDAVLATTDIAVLLDLGGGQEIWFPLSRCPDLHEVDRGDGPGFFECPVWLAENEDLV